jgi:WD40 repeat protein
VWSVGGLRSWEKSSLPQGGEVAAVAYAPDGKSLATASLGGGARIWNLTGVRPLVRTEIAGTPGEVRALQFTPDSEALVGVCDGPRVIHWEARTGRPAREWEVEGGPASAVALTRDGRYLSRGSASGAVEVHRTSEKRS